MNVPQPELGLSRLAVAGVQPDILCGSKGLGGAESELPSRFDFGQSSKIKASRRQRLAQASWFGFGGRSPARQAKRDSPVWTTRKCSRDSQSESAERQRVGRRPKDALAYALRAGESRFLAAGRQVFAKDAKQDTAEVVLSAQVWRSAAPVMCLALASAGYRKHDVGHLKQHQPDCLWRIHFVHKKWIGCSK